MPPRLRLPKRLLFRLPRPQSHSPTHPRTYSSSPPSSKISKLLDRFPRFLHPYTNGLRSAPGTHITSFLILHELTAIVPLIVLGVGFHYTGWLPGGLNEERVLGYMARFGGWFERKGWFGVHQHASDTALGEEADGGGDGVGGEMVGSEGEARHTRTVLTHQEEDRIVGEGRYGRGTRVVLEVATAYAITKALLPVRVVGSVWATPWFARTVLGLFKRFRR